MAFPLVALAQASVGLVGLPIPNGLLGGSFRIAGEALPLVVAGEGGGFGVPYLEVHGLVPHVRTSDLSTGWFVGALAVAISHSCPGDLAGTLGFWDSFQAWNACNAIHAGPVIGYELRQEWGPAFVQLSPNVAAFIYAQSNLLWPVSPMGLLHPGVPWVTVGFKPFDHVEVSLRSTVLPLAAAWVF